MLSLLFVIPLSNATSVIVIPLSNVTFTIVIQLSNATRVIEIRYAFCCVLFIFTDVLLFIRIGKFVSLSRKKPFFDWSIIFNLFCRSTTIKVNTNVNI